MNTTHYKKMTDSELVDKFEQLCLDQYVALEREEISVYNRRYKIIKAIENELKARDGDRRHLLKKFFGHGNLQLRLTAAHATLAVNYMEARRELELVASSKWNPQAGAAGMALDSLDRGIYRPT